MAEQTDPFIQLDNDFFTTDRFYNKINCAPSNSIICQNIEWLKIYDIGISELLEHGINLPEFVNYPSSKISINCGIVGINDITIVHDFCDKFLNWLTKNSEKLAQITNYHPLNFVFEQYFLAQYLISNQVPIFPLIDEFITDKSSVNLSNFATFGSEENTFIHLMNAKKNPSVIEGLMWKAFLNNPNAYQRAIGSSSEDFITDYCPEKREQNFMLIISKNNHHPEAFKDQINDIQSLEQARLTVHKYFSSTHSLLMNELKKQQILLASHNLLDYKERLRVKFSIKDTIHIHQSKYCWENSGYFYSPISGNGIEENITANAGNFLTLFYYLPLQKLAVEHILDGLNLQLLYHLSEHGPSSAQQVYQHFITNTDILSTSALSPDELLLTISIRLRQFVARGCAYFT